MKNNDIKTLKLLNKVLNIQLEASKLGFYDLDLINSIQAKIKNILIK